MTRCLVMALFCYQCVYMWSPMRLPHVELMLRKAGGRKAILEQGLVGRLQHEGSKFASVIHLRLLSHGKHKLNILTAQWKQPPCPSMDEWISKTWYAINAWYNGILFSLRKECGSSTYSAIGGPWRLHVRGNRPVTEGPVFYGCTYTRKR